LKARFGPRSERGDPQQLALFAEPSVASAVPAPPVETTVAAHVRRGGGRHALPDRQQRKRIEHHLAEHQKSCPGFGRKRERIGCETSDQSEFVSAVLKVIEHVRWKYACRGCQEHVATAPAPTKPLERGLPGPGLLAAIVVGKFSDHLPLYRLEDVFARSGVELDRSNLCRWARHTAKLLEPLYHRLSERVRASHVVHTDDTPVQVLDPALPKTRTGRFWVYVGDQRNLYAVYD
jgi:transposase